MALNPGYDAAATYRHQTPSEVAKSLLARDAMPETPIVIVAATTRKRSAPHARIFGSSLPIMTSSTTGQGTETDSATFEDPRSTSIDAPMALRHFLSRGLTIIIAPRRLLRTRPGATESRGITEHLDGLGTVDTLRKRRILVAAIGPKPQWRLCFGFCTGRSPIAAGRT